MSTATQKPEFAQDTPVRPPPVLSTLNCCHPAGELANAAPLLSMATQNVALVQDSPVNVPVPVSTMAGSLQIPLLNVTA